MPITLYLIVLVMASKQSGTEACTESRVVGRIRKLGVLGSGGEEGATGDVTEDGLEGTELASHIRYIGAAR